MSKLSDIFWQIYLTKGGLADIMLGGLGDMKVMGIGGLELDITTPSV